MRKQGTTFIKALLVGCVYRIDVSGAYLEYLKDVFWTLWMSQRRLRNVLHLMVWFIYNGMVIDSLALHWWKGCPNNYSFLSLSVSLCRMSLYDILHNWCSFVVFVVVVCAVHWYYYVIFSLSVQLSEKKKTYKKKRILVFGSNNYHTISHQFSRRLLQQSSLYRR